MLDQNDSQLSNTFLVYNMFPLKIPHWWPFERHKIDFLCTWFGHPYCGEKCLCLNIFTMSINLTSRNTCQIINWKISRTSSKRGGRKWEVFFGTKISGHPFQQNIPAMSAFPISASMGCFGTGGGSHEPQVVERAGVWKITLGKKYGDWNCLVESTWETERNMWCI